MRLLGIDYGKKRIGLALSDETGGFALPYRVLHNHSEVVADVAAVCQVEKVSTVVLGESRDLSGKENPIMDDIREFAHQLEAVGLSVVLVPEFFSSAAAARVLGRDEHLDARAAALILQSYLDKQK